MEAEGSMITRNPHPDAYCTCGDPKENVANPVCFKCDPALRAPRRSYRVVRWGDQERELQRATSFTVEPPSTP